MLQSTNRKLERRVKELSIQIDDERQHVNDQKDQVRMAATQPCGQHAPSTCLQAGEAHVGQTQTAGWIGGLRKPCVERPGCARP